MNNPFLRVAFSLLLLLALAAPGYAGGKKKKTIEYHDTVVSSVNGNTLTIIQDKTTKSYPMNQFTEVTIKGQRASAADLQSGMAVSVTLGTDGVTASRVAAGDPPNHPAPPPKR